MTGKSGKVQHNAARKARLSAALRENLKRRKAQARGRSQNRDQNDNQAASGTATTGEPQAPDFRRNQGCD